MIRTAILPYSRAGITGAAMLGLGRAIGETIAVTLLIGNAPTIGKQIFDQGYTLAAVIANEFGEAANKPIHKSALIAAGARAVRAHAAREPGRALVREPRHARQARRGRRRRLRGRRYEHRARRHQRRAAGARTAMMRGVLAAATVLALVPLVLIIWYLIKKGIGSWSGSFFTSDPNGNFLGDPGGVKSAILGTLEMVGLATLIAVPIGIGVALYLTEYGRERLVRLGGALLRRRDDGRAVDRLRPVRLHHARGRPASAAAASPAGRARSRSRC